ncbi:MAG: MMPL family transporter [Solirubrobacterales bacterium]
MLAVSAAVAVAAGVATTTIPTEAGLDTLVDSDSPTVEATERVRERFGEEPVVVLAKGDLPELLLSEDIFSLLRLEGCLSGSVPEGGKATPGPCAELAELEPVEFVSGPATFLNEAVVQIEAQLTRLAKRLPAERYREFLLEIATRYGITSLPSIDNSQFVSTVVFDLARERGTPKARLAYLFPNKEAAQIVVRLKPDLGEAERRRALELIEALVDESELENGTFVVSGAPVVVAGVSAALKGALRLLFVVALAVMSVTLVLTFRSRWPLLPLVVALAAAAIAFGLLGLLGGALTMASVAALPILIGLGVDYAIQFQARFDEAVEAGSTGVDAARKAAAASTSTVATACLATLAGFAALQLSPVPMVREFGVFLLVGVAAAFALSVTAGFAALALRPTGGRSLFQKWGISGGRRPGGDPPRRGGGSAAEHRGRDPGDRTRPPERLLQIALDHPKRVLAIAAVLAVAGWALGTQVETDADIRSLAPQGIPAVEALNEVQETTGVSGELDVSIEAPDLTDPATIEWMAGFKRRLLRENGFAGEDPSCLEADLCPGPALSDFVLRGEETPTRKQIRATLAALSPYALRQVAPVDPETGEVGEAALISFGIRAQSLGDQQALIDRVRAAIGEPGTPGGPPQGVRVELTGLPVIAAAAADELGSSRYWLTLAGIAAVAVALLAAYRSPRRALVPLVPTVLATGWAALVLWATGIPLNPMSAALGALTIAIATEFAVILSGRFHEERRGGHPVTGALERAYARTGSVVLVSGATAIAGFAVLLASDVQMLRDFGLVTVIDLVAALVGVLVALPAALVWSER